MVVVATTLAAVVAVAALVINVGQVLVTQAELKTVADLAAKSAAQELARVYTRVGRTDPQSDTLTSLEASSIATAADRRGRKNQAGSTAIAIASSDVHLGRWDEASRAFVASTVGVDAVEVTARRDSNTNGLLSLLFPVVFGRSTVPVQAQSAARLSGIRYLPAGVADIPIAISSYWYTTHASPCTANNRITFYPTGTADSCAGWHTFEQDPSSAAALKSILKGLRTGTYVSPAIDVSNTRFIFNGGVVATAMDDMLDLFNAKKNANGEMKVLLPVYEGQDCANPNGWIKIVGVARAVITNVVSGSDKLVEARVECDVVPLGASGGRDFGVLAAGPDLAR